MAARTFESDSGGTTRFTKRTFASDAGGVIRGPGRRIFVSDAGGIARLVFTGADFLTLITAGAPVGGSNGYIHAGFGSLAPTVLGDGTTVSELAASVTNPFPMILSLTGYPGSITSSYLTSLTLNGITFLATAATFGGGGLGGTAQWNWASGFHFLSSTTVPVVIQRT